MNLYYLNHLRNSPLLSGIYMQNVNCVKTCFQNAETCCSILLISNPNARVNSVFKSFENKLLFSFISSTHLSENCKCYQYTVKPVYEDRSREQKSAVFIDRWVTVRIAPLGPGKGGLYRQVVFICRSSLGQVRLYLLFIKTHFHFFLKQIYTIEFSVFSSFRNTCLWLCNWQSPWNILTFEMQILSVLEIKSARQWRCFQTFLFI